MSKILVLFIVTFVAVGSFLIPNSTTKNKKQNHHLKPGDEYYLSRNFPAGDEGQETYRFAVTKAKYFAKKYRNQNTPWRLEGPHNIGGRINSILIDPTNSNTIYVGTPASGIFKTTDGGQNWSQQFTQESTLSIGVLAMDPSNSNTIYAGTGDKALSSFTYLGNGIYKSTDAGQTWTNIGLTNVGVISKVIVDPSDSNTIYVGTMGNIYAQDNNRGLYKTTDGGLTWSQILFVATDGGIGDLAMHPTNHDTLFATGRNRIRTNAVSITTGPDAKIFRSYNGGQTWDTLTAGLPSSLQCKVSIAIAPSNPNIIYAVYCDTSLNYGATYRSTNGGNSWSLRNSSSSDISFGGFGWYFGEVRVAPNNANKLYIMGVELSKSNNGGSTWSLGAPPWYTYDVHADKHDLKFINNNDSEFLLATDGGIYKTTVGGGQNASDWTNLTNMPITQFYEVGYNSFDTVQYYAGAQDNGTQFGSASNGLNNWVRYFGGDGFKPTFHPTDSNTFYAQTQRGNVYGTDDGGFNWMNSTASIVAIDRCNWNTPYILSQTNSQTMYVGSYRVHKNTFAPFDTWNAISTDLTDGINNSNHTISSIDQSAINAQVLYAGTSDANLWVTQNDGTTWTRIDNSTTPDRYVSSIKASPNNVSNVFVSYWGYRDNDTNAHIYFSSNYGNSWTSIASNTLPNFAINDIWILPDGTDSSILIANDGGVYSTVNRGGKWSRVGNNMPIIPVYDLDLNIAQNRLIAGTFAMGVQTMLLDSVFKKKKVVFNTSIDDQQIDQLNIYPNPTNGLVNIKGLQHKAVLNIYTLSGQRVYQRSLSLEQEQVNINQLASGSYIIEIKSKEQRTREILTKQ